MSWDKNNDELNRNIRNLEYDLTRKVDDEEFRRKINSLESKINSVESNLRNQIELLENRIKFLEEDNSINENL